MFRVINPIFRIFFTLGSSIYLIAIDNTLYVAEKLKIVDSVIPFTGNGLPSDAWRDEGPDATMYKH